MTCRFRWACILTTLFILSIAATTWAQRPPASKVEILAPSAGQELTGAVDVRIKITPPEGGRMPALARAGFGGPPWESMERVEGTDEWTARLDTTLAPNGAQRLTVVTSETRAKAAVEVKLENPLQIFFAGLHSHTSYSDGTLLPSDAHRYAREEAELDVFSLTDHLESVDDAEWLDTREVAWDASEDGRFVAIPGLEWTKRWGHLNLFDPKTRHWPEDPEEFYAAAAAAGVVAKFNHPGDGTKTHAGLAYSEAGDKAVQLTEVRSDIEQQAFIRALNAGWHIAPEGSDDTHAPNWGNCGTWTGILAPGLSKRNVLDALANRRCYATRDRNCLLRFTANGAVAGTIIEEPVESVQLSVAVEDPDSDDLIAKVELFEDGAIVETEEPGAATCEWKPTRTPAAGGHYYFVKITQKDGNLLWSAPVWVTVGEQAAAE